MATTAGAALRLRLLCRMLRVGELLALAVLLLWSSSRVPSAAAAVLRFAGSLVFNPRFVFVLGNAIVLLLLALSRRDPSLFSTTNHPVTASAGAAQTPAAPAAPSFPSFTTAATTSTPMPVCEAPAAAVPVAPVVPAAPTVFEEDKPVPAPAVVRINKVRAPRRSRSEKMSSRMGAMRAVSPELRRSESDNGRRRRSSVTARDVAESRWGMEDADEFRRTVEAFIAKQTRFHREEESITMAVVAGAGHGEVSPAFAGALAVVE